MTAYASVRIRMEDRPGALSAVGAALAANGVDIVRLDVVSHDGREVVDDLFLAAAAEAEIDRALASFFTDVHVTRMAGDGEDPVVAMARAVEAITLAADAFRAQRALIAAATSILRTESGAIVSKGGDVIAGAPPTLIDLSEVSAAFRHGGAVTFRAGALRFAAVPCGEDSAVLVWRPAAIAFFQGELARLAALAAAAAAVMGSPAAAAVA